LAADRRFFEVPPSPAADAGPTADVEAVPLVLVMVPVHLRQGVGADSWHLAPGFHPES
jgi:hypothetical protein